MQRSLPHQAATRFRHFAIVMAALAGLLSVAAALAHARYDHSTPGQGEVVQASPARVDIFTAQDIKKQAGTYEITVADTSNARVDSGDTTIDDANRKHFSVGLKPSLPAGRYVVSFKTTSDEDGEDDHGQYAFYVGAQPTTAQKALDAKLLVTSNLEATPSSSSHTSGTAKSNSHTGLIVTIVVIVVVLVLLGGGFAYMRRRQAQP